MVKVMVLTCLFFEIKSGFFRQPRRAIASLGVVSAELKSTNKASTDLKAARPRKPFAFCGRSHRPFILSPDAVDNRRGHRRSDLAGEGLAERQHIHQHAIDAILAG